MFVHDHEKAQNQGQEPTSHNVDLLVHSKRKKKGQANVLVYEDEKRTKRQTNKSLRLVQLLIWAHTKNKVQANYLLHDEKSLPQKRRPRLTALSIWLQRAMSLCSVRSMIMATMPERKTAMTSELRMLNHWMLVWGIDSRMQSQRDDHFTHMHKYHQLAYSFIQFSCQRVADDLPTIVSSAQKENIVLLVRPLTFQQTE